MRLELVQNAIRSELHKELGIKNYLEMFNRDIPLIPLTVLRPLDKKEGEAHFQLLKKLTALHTSRELALDQLISAGRQLPQLDTLIPFLKSGILEQFQLFQLYQFLTVEKDLIELEGMHHPLREDSGAVDQLLVVMNKYTEGKGNTLSLSHEEKALRNSIHELDQSFNSALKNFEQRIENETTLRMIYPYLKEFDTETEAVKKARLSKNLKVTQVGSCFNISYVLTTELNDILQNKEALDREFKTAIAKKLKEINRELSQFSESFIRLYNARKDRLFKYTLCLTALEHKLCLPTFSEETSLIVEKASLPVLKENRKAKYIPLDMALDRGANILYGANMSGKTTVLKTLYFLLNCIMFGLPIPAQAITLKYPSLVALSLKSSGQLDQNISSFGEELEFFSQNFTDSSYIFSDELFQSTSPESGATLCDITLEIMGSKDLVFLASTHYPSVLTNKDLSLYKMKEMVFDREIDRELSIQDLVGRTPFEVVRITDENFEETLLEGKTPLKIAMHFPLSDDFKAAIRKKLP